MLEQREGVRGLGVLAEHDDPDLGMGVAQRVGGADPLVGSGGGHPDVGQHDVGRVGVHRRQQRFEVLAHTCHLDPALLEQAAHRLPQEIVVLGDDYPLRHEWDSSGGNTPPTVLDHTLAEGRRNLPNGTVSVLTLLWRADWRSRWRSWLGVALLAGLAGGIVLASIAGARRTGSALERFERASRAPHAFAGVRVEPGERADWDRLGALRTLPEVDALGAFSTYWLFPSVLSREEQALFVAHAADDEVFTREVAIPVVLDGRRAEPGRADELEINEDLAERLDVEPGDRVTFESLTPEQLATGEATGRFGDPAGPEVELTVVGIVRNGSDILRDSPGTRDTFPAVFTPAFAEANVDDIGNMGGSMAVRLRNGPDDVDDFADGMRRIYRGSEIFVSGGGSFSPGERSVFDVPRAGLFIFAAAVAIAGMVVVGQAVARQVLARRFDGDVLDALGMPRRVRLLAAAGAIVPAAVASAAVAAALMVAASPLFPFGSAVRGEPDPGFSIDTFVLVAGMLGVFLVLAMVALLSALQLVRERRTPFVDASGGRPPSIVSRVRAGWVPLTTVIGVRMALERGHGRAAVPVRPALTAAIVGALGVVGALVVGSSLDRAATTPARFGWNWDLAVDAGGDRDGAVDLGAELAEDPVVERAAVVEVAQVAVDGRQVQAQTFRPLSGAIAPTIIKGRVPLTADEVALGFETMSELDVGVGETVEIRGPLGREPYRVVGQAILPVLSGDTPSEGAVFVGDLQAEPRDSSTDDTLFVLVTTERGAEEELAARLQRDGRVVTGAQRPRDVSNLRELASLPFVVAAALAVLAVGAVVHALVTGVRRRNRELAVLGALGFDDRQLGRVVRWQALTIVTIGLVAGIPLGLAAGRWVWSTIASNTGLAGDPSFPVLWLFAAAAAALVLAAVVAALPAHLAARIPLASTLRSE